MKKILIMCWATFVAVSMFGQKPDRKYCTTGTYFSTLETPNGFDVFHFFDPIRLKKIKSHVIPKYEGIPSFEDMLDQAMDDADALTCEKMNLLFSQVDTSLDYKGNEKLIREEVLNQSIIDLSTPSGRMHARKIVYAIAMLIEKQSPSAKKGKLKNDLKTVYCFGWVKLFNGDTVIPYLRCTTDSNEYSWQISVTPATGTIGLRDTYFLGEQ